MDQEKAGGRCSNNRVMFRKGQKMPYPFITERSSHARIVSIPNEVQCLDTVQLNRMEQSFRKWSEGSSRADIRLSRKRILLIFLLIRYTGAKLNEVLAFNPFHDIDFKRRLVFFGKSGTKNSRPHREVQIPESLSGELKTTLDDPFFKKYLQNLFQVDPG